jgi:uncharacterized protein (TIGR03435 family)
MKQLTRIIGTQLSIAATFDPSRPAMASDRPVLVLDKTGLTGVYEFTIRIAPEIGSDMFVLWQRFLRDQLGLKLEPGRFRSECIVIDRVNRVPFAN